MERFDYFQSFLEVRKILLGRRYYLMRLLRQGALTEISLVTGESKHIFSVFVVIKEYT